MGIAAGGCGKSGLLPMEAGGSRCLPGLGLWSGLVRVRVSVRARARARARFRVRARVRDGG